MPKRAAALILSLVLALTLAACGEESRPRPSSAAPEPSSRLIESEAPADPAAPQADDALVREIIKTYGAEEAAAEDGTLRLKTKMVSLFFDEEGWDDPEKLRGIQYFSWFLSTTFDEDYEYKLTHYIHPDIGEEQGWFFPQELYEERIQTYFAVSTDYLRGDEQCYSPERRGYWIGGGGGGRGEEPLIDYRYSQEGDLLTIEIDLYGHSGDLMARRVLNAGLEAGGGWKYVGYRALGPQ